MPKTFGLCAANRPSHRPLDRLMKPPEEKLYDYQAEGVDKFAARVASQHGPILRSARANSTAVRMSGGIFAVGFRKDDTSPWGKWSGGKVTFPEEVATCGVAMSSMSGWTCTRKRLWLRFEMGPGSW